MVSEKPKNFFILLNCPILLRYLRSNMCSLLNASNIDIRISCFRMSWFIIYGIFVLLLSAVGVILLFTLQMFQHTHFLPIFLLVVLYSFSIIMFAFMITPFFDKSRVSILCCEKRNFSFFFFFKSNIYCNIIRKAFQIFS